MKETDRIIDRMLDLTAGIADELLLLKDAQANRLPDGLKLKIISLAELAAIPSGDDREEVSGEEPEAGTVPPVPERDVVRSAEYEEEADAGDVPSAEPPEAPAPAEVPGPAASETENREPRNSAEEETEEILEMIPDEVPESSVTPPPVEAPMPPIPPAVPAATPPAAPRKPVPAVCAAPALTVADFQKAFSINDAFLFRREIFNGSRERLNDSLEIISHFQTAGQLRTYLETSLGLDLNQAPGKEFYEALRTFFSN